MVPANPKSSGLLDARQKLAFGPVTWVWGLLTGVALWLAGFILLPWVDGAVDRLVAEHHHRRDDQLSHRCGCATDRSADKAGAGSGAGMSFAERRRR